MNAHGIRDDLLKIIGHLGTAEVQSLPSDDQIIMDHVREALEIARAALTATNTQAPALNDAACLKGWSA
ncbi:hypothetical protein [Roseixanthobacter pseudopolyaromaticivorans]|uniref:hypothetical protein n=1 Tax=Xanthobacteraceae TaxID=335928 RepID=UPI00372CB95E